MFRQSNDSEDSGDYNDLNLRETRSYIELNFFFSYQIWDVTIMHKYTKWLNQEKLIKFLFLKFPFFLKHFGVLSLFTFFILYLFK